MGKRNEERTHVTSEVSSLINDNAFYRSASETDRQTFLCTKAKKAAKGWHICKDSRELQLALRHYDPVRPPIDAQLNSLSTTVQFGSRD